MHSCKGINLQRYIHQGDYFCAMFYFRHIQEIRSICRDCGVSVLYATGDLVYDPHLVPDILQLVVTFLPENGDVYFHNFYLLQQEISSILGISVELTDWDQLKNQVIKKRILEHSEVMYNHTIDSSI
jgi:predicted nucleotidyltransferase